jgi:hypothetical protein
MERLTSQSRCKGPGSSPDSPGVGREFGSLRLRAMAWILMKTITVGHACNSIYLGGGDRIVTI